MRCTDMFPFTTTLSSSVKAYNRRTGRDDSELSAMPTASRDRLGLVGLIRRRVEVLYESVRTRAEAGMPH